MSECPYCQSRARELGMRTPVGYNFFGYSPHTEEPAHIYVFKDGTPELDPDTVQELHVEKLCELKDPVSRAQSTL